ncbi:MAG: UDP-N-acetylglucosamine 1-carboxyvinyltransferase [Saprospirales bacterium]|nr:MAG: UDP-N-acetylglucosamine 1-carboxyvinyltransferase [Saprospirales bacterium]
MSYQAFEVEGGHSLNGTVSPQGAKNEALQVICAVLLTEERVVISNIPDILDVVRLIDLLRGLGVKVERLAEDTYSFEASEIDLEYTKTETYHKNASKIRGSVMLMGPMLARFGMAFLPQPGGDKIGRRRMDTHFLGFRSLGAEFRYDAVEKTYLLDASGLKGGFILMDEISVTGTANILMAASLIDGTTTIYNAACEPYIQQLCSMLTAMGAIIEGQGSNLLRVTGVTRLKGTEHKVLPDMIEIGSFIGLAAMTSSEITIANARPDKLGVILPTFRKLGLKIETRGEDIFIPKQDQYEIQTFIDGSIMTIYDAPWPGFTPDLMSIVLVTAIQAKGSLLIHQKMFESRLFFVDKLIDMGAQIILCDPHRATVIGLERKYPLRGIEMSSPDIRAGVALLIAALSAEGKSTIYNINQIDRGYQKIDDRLRALGANIKRVEAN